MNRRVVLRIVAVMLVVGLWAPLLGAAGEEDMRRSASTTTTTTLENTHHADADTSVTTSSSTSPLPLPQTASQPRDAMSIIKQYLLNGGTHVALSQALLNARHVELSKQVPASATSMLAVFQKIRRDAVETKNGTVFHTSTCRGGSPCARMIPMLCSPVTAVDFFAQLTMVACTDVTVAHYFIVVDGKGAEASIVGHFWRAVADLVNPSATEEIFLPPVVVKTHAERKGVSFGWNRCIREAFAKVTESGRYPSLVVKDHWDPEDAEGLGSVQNARQMALPFIVIANSDVWPKRGWVKKLVASTFEGQDVILINRFSDFAYFAFTRRAYHVLGYFDEVFYPAYAEDQEMHARAVSVGMGEMQHVAQCCHGVASEMFYHLTSTNAKQDPKTRYYAIDPNEYILKKWGFHRGTLTDYRLAKPFRHPFNNSNIRTNNSWVVDTEHRACLKRLVRLESGKCTFNVSVVKLLEGSPRTP